MNIKMKNRGSAADMLDAFSTKLEELNGNVESCVNSDKNVESACDKYDEVSSCDDNIYSDDNPYNSDYDDTEDNFNYIMDVFDEVSNELVDIGADNISYSMESTCMMIYFSLNGDIYEVEVPFEDITGNFDEDVRHIYYATTDFD